MGKAAKVSPAASPGTAAAADGRNHINELPDELLLKILQQLGRLPPEGCREAECPSLRFPFRRVDGTSEPHPGLRSYPFLGQVCKRWKAVLGTPAARAAIWGEVVVDFGHELITAVHTPIAWSDTRPSDEQFRASFSRTRLDAQRILAFVADRRPSLRRVVLMSSEGYYSDEGDFVNLVSKHDFTMVSFGALCGLLWDRLQQLTVLRCSDFFNANAGAFGAIASLRALVSLRVEDLHCHLDQEAAATLARLTQLTELVLTVQHASSNSWLIGLEKLPSAWSSLASLRTLVLRGHGQLAALPGWLPALPLTQLDLSLSRAVAFDVLPKMAGLRTLCLEDMHLAEHAQPPGQPPQEPPTRLLPPGLTRLTNLTALNLAENRFSAVPACLAKLPRLRFLDLSGNELLQVQKPLTPLYGLASLELVDLRLVHMECHLSYWSDAKCATMSHLAAWQKAARRRGGCLRILLDTDG